MRGTRDTMSLEVDRVLHKGYEKLVLEWQTRQYDVRLIATTRPFYGVQSRTREPLTRDQRKRTAAPHANQ